jgi:hypothetical protein
VVNLCWLCEARLAERGGVCHACRLRVRDADPAPKLRLGLSRLAGVLAALLSISAAMLTPALVSPPTLPWRHLISHSRLTATPVTYRTTMVMDEVKRKVYPYSIVPGGAANVHEAKVAMTDPAVQSHYAGVDLAQLKEVKLTANLSGYVSYRWGDKIYWTKKMVTLRAGETVFTDGSHIVRGRCLNCYSALPMSPIRPNEPTEAVLDAPVEMPETVYSFPKLPVLAPELPIPPGELTPVVPAILPTAISTIGKTGGGIWFPILPIIPPIHRHPSSPSVPTAPIPPVVPPVAIVPEPHYGWILAVGFLAVALANRLRRRTLP